MGLKSIVFSLFFLSAVSASAIWKGDVTSAYPSTVRIRVSDMKCSAIVLSANWLLTAGHCVEGSTKEKTMRIGIADGGMKSYKVHRIYPHPAYRDGFTENPNPAQSRYDLALIHLARSVDAPAASFISTESELKKALFQGKAFAVGYGRSNSGGDKKRVAVLPATLTVADYIETSTNSFGQGTCEGDSGSGLYVNTAQGPKVVGINSILGRLSGSKQKGELCGGIDSIGVIATIYAEADWIQNTSGVRF